MAVYVVHDWISGKRTVRGQRVTRESETVTVVTRDAVDDFLRVKSQRARTAHLQRLRDRGALVHTPGRLTAKVRGLNDRAYVFRGEPEYVPRARRQTRGVRLV